MLGSGMTTRPPRQPSFKTLVMMLALVALGADPALAKPRDPVTAGAADVQKSKTRIRKRPRKARKKLTRFQQALRRCNAYRGSKRTRCRRRTMRRFRSVGVATRAPRPTSTSQEQTLPEAAPSELSAPAPDASALPDGNAIANLAPTECYALLSEQGVSFARLDAAEAPQVEIPIKLLGSVGGVEIRGPKRDPSSVLDCRLVVAIFAWAPTLRAAGVRVLEHFSIYRAQAIVAGTGKLSGHAMGRAIDLARIALEDGTTLSVLEDWTSRRRGTPPCASYPRETEASRRWRNLICAAARGNLFQVILTPHHDRAHTNHVHLEVVPQVDWSYIR